MNYGFVKPHIDNTQYVLGGLGSLPKVVVREDGQWDDFLPKDEFQRNEHIDTQNCTGYGTENAIEILIKAKYGEEYDFSERDLGIRAGTYPPGNDPHIVAEAARNSGLISDTVLPFRKDIETVDEYYSYDGNQKTCNALAQKFLNKFNIYHEWVKSEDMKETLRYSPFGVAVYAWEQQGDVYVRPRGKQDVHWCVIYGYYDNGDWKCFDSYDYSKKRLAKDFGFNFIKRYHVVKKEEQSGWFIINFIKSLWRKMFPLG